MLHAGRDGKSNGVGIIVSEKISKAVVRVESWQGRITVAWMMVKIALYLCMGFKQEGLRQRKGPLWKSWREWWD